MDKDVINLMVVVLIVALIFGLILFISFIYLDKAECQAKAKLLNLTSEYHILTGCVITKENGKKVLLEQIRVWE